MLVRRQVERARRALRLNEQLAQTFETPVPEPLARPPEPATSHVPPIRSKAGALSTLVAVLIAAFLVATNIETRTTVTRDRSKSSWALNADDACARMVARYRQANLSHGPATSPPDRELSEIATIRREGLYVAQDAVTSIRAAGPPPSGPPAAAIAALELKIDREWDAVRAADRGDRAGYEQAMARTIAPAWDARRVRRGRRFRLRARRVNA